MFLLFSFDICHIFVCGTRHHQEKPDIRFLYFDNKFCFFPEQVTRTGTLQSAPNYMKCSENQNKFCFQGECTSDLNLLKTCKYGFCSLIDNTIKRKMKKIMYVPGNDFSYFVISSQNYVPSHKGLTCTCGNMVLIDLAVLAIALLLPMIILPIIRTRL